MKAMNTIKKFGYKILRKFGIVGKEYQLLPSNFPVANINTTFNQIGKLNPRVTHPTEYVVLGVLASITKQNILKFRQKQRYFYVIIYQFNSIIWMPVVLIQS